MDISEVQQALNDSGVKQAIQESISAKVNQIVQEKIQDSLNEKTDELDKLCEEYKQAIQSRNEKILKEHCEEYEAKIKQKYSKLLESYISELGEAVSQYMDEVVNEFVSEHRADFAANRKRMKIDAVMESLRAVCSVAGVKAEQISEGLDTSSTEKAMITEQRIQNLKEQLLTAESENQHLKNTESDLLTEREKVSELESALKEYVHRVKDSESENGDLRESLDSVNSKLSDLKDKYRNITGSFEQLKKKNESLQKENDQMFKMGVIAELKQGMTLTEAKNFERIAEQLPFERNKQYFDKLEILKDQLLNNPKYKKLNEITGEEDDPDNPGSSDKSDPLFDFGDLDSLGLSNASGKKKEYDAVTRWEHMI